MIKCVTGNLLESNAEILINTVNCEGFMGKGIAYQFKMRYPQNNIDYVKACRNKTLTIGKLHYYKEDGKIIVNFPTKDKWRNKSKIEYIEKGMEQLQTLIPQLNAKSIAIPPLGCGNGGLEWTEVKSIILDKIRCFEESHDIYIYEPSKNYIPTVKEVPRLSLSALILMQMKLQLKKFNTLRLQKTAYFMNIFLKDKYFKFKKHKFGPYDNSIAIISKNIKAFQNYYNTKDTEEAYKIAYNVVISNKSDSKLRMMQPSIMKAVNYVNKIVNDSFLECIATIAFLIENNNLENKLDIVNAFKEWSEDKAKRFSEDIILEGVDYLIDTQIIIKTLVGYKLL